MNAQRKDTVQGSTFFALLAEFNTADIPLEFVAEKYFGLTPQIAVRYAIENKLPCPAYRGASRKSPWLVNAADLSRMIDEKRAAARTVWERAQP